jgi:hypothetical protein
MFTPCRIFRRISSSTPVGGGAHGRDAGTVPVTMTEDGLIIIARHLFTETFLNIGEVITETIVGRETHGDSSGYPIATCSVIGKAGNTTDIGNKTDGVCNHLKREVPREMQDINAGHSHDQHRDQAIEDNFRNLTRKIFFHDDSRL